MLIITSTRAQNCHSLAGEVILSSPAHLTYSKLVEVVVTYNFQHWSILLHWYRVGRSKCQSLWLLWHWRSGLSAPTGFCGAFTRPRHINTLHWVYPSTVVDVVLVWCCAFTSLPVATWLDFSHSFCSGWFIRCWVVGLMPNLQLGGPWLPLPTFQSSC